MKKRLLSVALLMGTMAANAQVGIGTATPNKSAELLIESKNRGLLIPNVALTDTKDKTTITNGNVQSLLVYATKEQKDITPGYYYWDVNVWKRLTADADIPKIVVNKFSDILNLENKKVENIIKNLINANETLTVLAFDPKTGVLTYTDEKKQPTTIDVKAAVKAFETVTSITTDAAKGTITFVDEKGASTVLDIKALVKANETVTTLVRDEAGKYTYTNEAGTESKITVIGDITEVIKGKTDKDLYNVLKQLVNVEQTLTKLVYNATDRQLAYTDEQNATHNIDVDALVKGNQTLTTLKGGTNIKVTEVKGANSISYTLDVPTATKDAAGVVKPGSGLDIDADGNLTVNLDTALNGKDLTGNEIIVVTDGKGAVLRETKLEIKEDKLSLQNIGGTLNLTQLQAGNAGDVLVVNKDGDVVWSAKDAITTNSLVLNGTELTSTVNGVPATQTLKDRLTTEMLKDGSVTAEKLEAGEGNEGKVPVAQADGTVVYQNISSTNVDGKALTSANDLMTVSNSAGVVLKDVVLTIDQTKFELNKIGGTLQLTQIEKGEAGSVLVTDKDGTIKWVKEDAAIIKDLVNANETVTSIVDHGNGTFTYTDEEGKTVTFDANTVSVVEKDGVYTFKNKNKEGENVITTIDTNAIASAYDNTNSGLTAENVQAAIDELVNRLNGTSDSLVDLGNGKYQHTTVDGKVIEFDINTVNVEKVTDAKGNVSYVFKDADGTAITTISLTGDVVENITKQGDVYDAIINMIKSETDSLVDLGNGKYQHTTVDGKVIEFDINTVNVEKVTDAKGNVSYVFKDADGTAITTISLTGDVVENITKQGDVYDAIINMIKSETDSLVDLGNGKYQHTTVDGKVIEFDINTVNVEKVTDAKGNVSYVFKDADGTAITTISLTGDVVENITKQGDVYDAIINMIKSETDSLVDLGNGKYQHTTVDGKVIEFDINTVNVEKVTDAKGNVSYVFKDADGTAITTISLTGDVVENITKQGDVYDAIINMIKSEEKTTVVAQGTGITVTPKTEGKVTTYTVSADASNITLGGDVTGNADNTTISKLQGKELDAKDPQVGNVLVFEGGKWITKAPSVNADNVTNGKALTSTEKTIDVSVNGATSLLKDVQIDVANGAISNKKLATNAVTNEKIAGGAVTTDKITGGDNGQVLTTTVSTEGKKTVEWKTPTVNTTDITGKGNLTSTTANLLTVKDGNGAVLQNVSLTVNQDKFDLNQIGGTLNTTQIKPGNDNQVLTTVNNGGTNTVVWTDKEKPTTVTGSKTETGDVEVKPGTNPNEYIVDVKAAMPKVFYMPPVMFDTSKKHNEVQTRNLYDEYVAMFGGTGAVVDTPISGDRPAIVKSDANATIPVYKKEDLNFFVPYYDPTVFSDVKVDADGKLTYKVIKKAKYGAFMTVVFVVK